MSYFSAFMNKKSRVCCLIQANQIYYTDLVTCRRLLFSENVLISSEAETTCSNPAVANGAQSRRGDAAVYRVGDSVTFTCAQGFQLAGGQQVTCGPAGQWQPPLPQCLPSANTTLSPDREG